MSAGSLWCYAIVHFISYTCFDALAYLFHVQNMFWFFYPFSNIEGNLLVPIPKYLREKVALLPSSVKELIGLIAVDCKPCPSRPIFSWFFSLRVLNFTYNYYYIKGFEGNGQKPQIILVSGENYIFFLDKTFKLRLYFFQIYPFL